jgi:hypothetical protein
LTVIVEALLGFFLIAAPAIGGSDDLYRGQSFEQ